ncbi:MAG: 3-deoxy-D-manno-octulosonic acid transferase [Desulfovibrionaceae bacterium]|nr:3-deoxy-D-manno-octulosonic acid transferase [Desulfovibrionaceae bacterium]
MGTEGRSEALPRLYGLAWRGAFPFLKRNQRLADGWSQRLVPDGWAEPADLWVQAASGGEAFLAASLIEALPASSAPCRVLATTWTRQGLDVLVRMQDSLRQKRPDLSVQATLCPLDSPELTLRAVRMVRPRVLALLETELWPGLLLSCAGEGVPVIVLNGRMTEKSLRNFLRLGRLFPEFWSSVAPAEIAAVSSRDAERFRELFGGSACKSAVSVVPNIKFDRAAPESLPDASPLRLLLPDIGAHPLALFASVREEEESLLLEALPAFREAQPGMRLVIAPRHLHRAAAWKEGLEKSGFSIAFRSQLEGQELPLGTVIVWDVFGELMPLYTLAERVFVGGSLAPLGGQNLLEPLACGRVPYVGPFTSNFSWALRPAEGEGLLGCGLVRECAGAADLAAAMGSEEPRDPGEVRAAFAAWLAPHRGGLARCADIAGGWLQPMRDPPPCLQS